MKSLLWSLGCVLAISTQASAQQFNAADIDLSYAAFNDTDDLNATKLRGSLEIGFTRAFAWQFDLMTSGRDGSSEALDGQNLTLHPIWHYTDNTSFGVFISQDELADTSATGFGFEFGWEERDRKIEAYIGLADDGTENITLIGANGEWDLTYAWSIGGSIEYADFETDASISTLTVRGMYDFGQGGGLYAGLGQVSADNAAGSDDDTFLQIGATFHFGRERGTTFGERGLLGLLQ
jgi:hypothetical protein